VIAGHFGFAAGVKAQSRPTPLRALMLAAVWLDLVFVPLFIGKIETVEAAPGAAPGYGASIIHADYTHSLVGAVALSALFGLVFGLRWGRTNGLVLGLVAFSHWVLDVITHRPDMPLMPGGGGPKFGLGLWRWPMATAAVELLLVVVGVWLYWRAARAAASAAGKGGMRANLAGALVLICGVGVLALDVTGILG
jgi:hypothetical protein